jgi:hypothetical protein
LPNLAEKASRFRFTTFHIPSVLNNIPDSLSRYTVGGPEHLNLEGRDCGLPPHMCLVEEGRDCGELDGPGVEQGPKGGPRLV